jgi:uncharacterized protein (TIRG00374 family)
VPIAFTEPLMPLPSSVLSASPSPRLPRSPRRLKALVSLTVLALLVVYGRTVQWSAVWQAIRAASLPLVALAALANLVTLLAKTLTWWLFLRPVGIRSFGLVWRAMAAGAGLNTLLVANGGEAARVVLLARASGRDSAPIVAALAFERLFDLLGYLLLLVAAVVLLPVPPVMARWRPTALLALVGLVLLFGVLVRAHRGPPSPAVGTARSTGVRARLRRWLGSFLERLVQLANPGRLAAGFALTVVNWGAQVASYHLAARALHFPISAAGSVVALLTTNVGFLVRATPGNVGVFQLVYALTAQAMGLPKSAAVGAAILVQSAQNLPVIALGAVLAPDLVLARAEAGAP